MRHTIVSSAILVTLSGTVIAAASNEPAMAHQDGSTQSGKPRHARATKPKLSPTALGAALADPRPTVESYHPASVVAPVNHTDRTWTGFHVGVGLGGAR